MTSPEATIEREEEVLPISEEELVEGLQPPFNEHGVGEAFERLVLQMKEKLADYDIVISDDASARLVTLTMQEVINKKRAEKDREFAPTIFIAGGRKTGNKPEVEEALRKKDIRGKALLVTEYIDSGESISWLIQILNRLNIDFDVATISSEKKPRGNAPGTEDAGLVWWPKNLQRIEDEGRLHCGAIGSVGIHFYNTEQIGGVTKDVHSKKPFPRKSFNANRDLVVRSRQDSSVLAGRLYEVIKEEK